MKCAAVRQVLSRVKAMTIIKLPAWNDVADTCDDAADTCGDVTDVDTNQVTYLLAVV